MAKHTSKHDRSDATYQINQQENKKPSVQLLLKREKYGIHLSVNSKTLGLFWESKGIHDDEPVTYQ